jgi:hypothetical protein
MLLFVAYVMEKYPTRDGKLAFVTQLDNIIYVMVGEPTRNLVPDVIFREVDRSRSRSRTRR